MNSLSVLTFFVLLTFVAANKTDSHHLILGTRYPMDRHLIREVAYSKSGFMRKKTGDYAYEPKNVPNPTVITRVEVMDQYTNGNGGYATLTRGGPGFSFVKLHFTSQWWRGYNFIIDIYGR